MSSAAPPDAAVRIRRYAWLLIAVALAWRVWAVSRAWFWQDDFVHIYQASTTPFVEFLGRAWNGHLEPAAWAVYWVATAWAPQQWALPFVVVSVVQVCAAVVFWRIVQALGPIRWVSLVPLAFFLFGNTTLTAQLWFAVAIDVCTVELFLLVAVLGVVRVVDGGRRRWVAVVVASLVAGLLFSERALVILPFCFLVAMVLGSDGLRSRLRSAWRASPLLWVLLAIVSVGYLAVYARVVGLGGQLSGSLPLPAWVSGAWVAVAETLVPTLVGGNWAPPIDGNTPVPRPVTPLLLAAWGAALGGVLLLLERRPRRTGPALWLVGIVTGLMVVLSLAARGDDLGELTARDPRYLVFAAVAAALALAVVIQRGGPQRLLPVRGPAPWVRNALAAGVAVVLAVSCFPTLLYTGEAAATRFSRQWVDAARASVAASGGTVFADTRVPDAVLSGFQPDEYRWTSTVLSPGPNPPVFNRLAQDVRAINGIGESRPAKLLDVESRAAPGPDEGCGYRVTTGEVTVVPLQSESGDEHSAIRVSYFSGSDSEMEVVTGASKGTVSLRAGLDRFWAFPGEATGRLALRVVTPGATVCVTEAQLGLPWPDESASAGSTETVG